MMVSFKRYINGRVYNPAPDPLPPEELAARKKAVSQVKLVVELLALGLMVLGAAAVVGATLYVRPYGLLPILAVSIGGTLFDCLVGLLFAWFIIGKIEPLYIKFCDVYDGREQHG